jgi:hypothetical protein
MMRGLPLIREAAIRSRNETTTPSLDIRSDHDYSNIEQF